MRSGARVRSRWGVVLAGCSAALAVAAHGAGGGDATGTPLAVLVTGLLAWTGTVAVGRRGTGALGTLGTLLVLTAAQLGEHLALSGLGDSGAAGHAGHAGHVVAPVDPAAMLAWHAVAIVLTTWLLTGAESALRSAAGALDVVAGLVRSILLPLSPREPRVVRVPVRADSTDHVREVLLRRQHGRRGPPTV